MPISKEKGPEVFFLIHSIKKLLLSIYYVLSAFLSTYTKQTNKKNKNPFMFLLF